MRYIVSAASDSAVASHAGADRLLRTEPQVCLWRIHNKQLFEQLHVALSESVSRIVRFQFGVSSTKFPGCQASVAVFGLLTLKARVVRFRPLPPNSIPLSQGLPRDFRSSVRKCVIRFRSGRVHPRYVWTSHSDYLCVPRRASVNLFAC